MLFGLLFEQPTLMLTVKADAEGERKRRLCSRAEPLGWPVLTRCGLCRQQGLCSSWLSSEGKKPVMSVANTCPYLRLVCTLTAGTYAFRDDGEGRLSWEGIV